VRSPRDLYQQHYGSQDDPIYREIRAETYRDDMGQTSWLTVAELQSFLAGLQLTASCRVLEVACGSGGASVAMAHETGARVVGVDASEPGVQAAKARAAAEIHNDRVTFMVADATRPLLFPDRSFNAIFCNDAINHLGDRRAVLADWYRLLRPGGRLLYTDPVVVSGAVSAAEFAARSTIGEFVFMPRGENELLLGESGFRCVRSRDVSDNIIEISRRWRDARSWRRDELVARETGEGFLATQRFLNTVHLLAEEGRLSRYAFTGSRPGENT
jgi:SAM-dependent methyltransferase